MHKPTACQAGKGAPRGSRVPAWARDSPHNGYVSHKPQRERVPSVRGARGGLPEEVYSHLKTGGLIGTKDECILTLKVRRGLLISNVPCIKLAGSQALATVLSTQVSWEGS